MKSRICLRLGRPPGRLRGMAILRERAANVHKCSQSRACLVLSGTVEGLPSWTALIREPGCRTVFSAKLAILAAAPIDRGVHDRLVALGLARDAGTDAGKRLAPALRDGLAAIVAFLCALALRRQCAGAKNRVLHGVV